jgi:hypothetical protein
MGLAITPLDKGHDRKQFACGQPELDDWFRRRANQDDKRNIARVFVATDDDLDVIGFYSLSAFTLAIGDLPEEIGSKLPRYDAIPAALIGPLARDIRARGRGIGELVLACAVRRILRASRSVVVFAIVVEAEDAAASAFDQSFGFRPFPLRPQRLFRLASTAAAFRRGRGGACGGAMRGCVEGSCGSPDSRTLGWTRWGKNPTARLCPLMPPKHQGFQR